MKTFNESIETELDCTSSSRRGEIKRSMRIQARIWFQQRRLEDAHSEVLHALAINEKLGVEEGVEGCRGLLQMIERAMKT